MAGISNSVSIYPHPVCAQSCGAAPQRWDVGLKELRGGLFCGAMEVSDLLLKTTGRQLRVTFRRGSNLSGEKKITWGIVKMPVPEQLEILMKQVWWEARGLRSGRSCSVNLALLA